MNSESSINPETSTENSSNLDSNNQDNDKKKCSPSLGIIIGVVVGIVLYRRKKLVISSSANIETINNESMDNELSTTAEI